MSDEPKVYRKRFAPIEETFWPLLDRSGDCWLWTGSRHPRTGYGQIKVNGRSCKAHRVAYELSYGPIPRGLLVCHRCDTPACCRPEHLFVGTQTDNMHDMAVKGRGWKGRSGLHGIRRNASGKWTARRSILGRLVHLGTFSSDHDAQEAWRAALARATEQETKG